MAGVILFFYLATCLFSPDMSITLPWLACITLIELVTINEKD